MKKTLVRFIGGAVMVCGALLGSSTNVHAQPASLFIYADTVSGPARQMVGPQVIHVINQGGADATGVVVTIMPPKGAKVDTAGCQEDHLPGGFRSYTCLVGALPAGQKVDITFSISMNKSGTADIGVDAACDQGDYGALLSITIF